MLLLLFLSIIHLIEVCTSFSVLRSSVSLLAKRENIFSKSVLEMRRISTRFPLTSNLFAKKQHSEGAFVIGLQIISRITVGQVFRFYCENLLYVFLLVVSQELIRFISAGQFAPREYPKKLVPSEVALFMVLLPFHYIMELIRCVSMLVQLVVKLMWILVKGLIAWLSAVSSIAVGLFFGFAIIGTCLIFAFSS